MMDQNWRDKRIWVTGVCGTMGRGLLRQLVAEDAAEIVGRQRFNTAVGRQPDQYHRPGLVGVPESDRTHGGVGYQI